MEMMMPLYKSTAIGCALLTAGICRAGDIGALAAAQRII